MFAAFANREFRRLFAAQIVALLGTGMLTVALSLLAYDLAGDRAGQVLGIAFAIKMVAYVGVSPLAAALLANLSRKWVLIGSDILRSALAVFLPFVDTVWQIYLLIFLLQAASASFTPVFQAMIADLLRDEAEYTSSLSLSRAAYDLESLLSPLVAALFLSVVAYSGLFVFTIFGFAISALLILSVALPSAGKDNTRRSFMARLSRGGWIYLSTPRLRGLLSVTAGAAALGAFVIVNTVLCVRQMFNGDAQDVTFALAAFGGGSLLAAIVLPRVLQRISERSVMTGAAMLVGLLASVTGYLTWQELSLSWTLFLSLWALIGMGYSAILTPGGRLLRQSSGDQDRAALFAAQFALSHACWLAAYPLAGFLGEAVGLMPTLMVLGGTAVATGILARVWWPAADRAELVHDHVDLPSDHPHLQDSIGGRHSHAFVIDDLHLRWPDGRSSI